MASSFNVSLLGLLFYSVVTALYVHEYLVDTDLYRQGKYNTISFPFDSSYCGRLKFLTHIDVFLQAAYFGIAAVNALFGAVLCKYVFSSCSASTTSKKSSSSSSKKCNYLWINSALNNVYVSIIFPVGIFVSVVFWSLYFIDRELVYPKTLDSIIPVYINHIMHTLPLVTLLLEHYLVDHEYPTLQRGISLTGLFVLSYGAWVLYIGYDSNKWVYPILKTLSSVSRLAFIGSQVLLACFIYKFGQLLHDQFWPHGRSSGKSSKSSSSKAKQPTSKIVTRSKTKSS